MAFVTNLDERRHEQQLFFLCREIFTHAGQVCFLSLQNHKSWAANHHRLWAEDSAALAVAEYPHVQYGEDSQCLPPFMVMNGPFLFVKTTKHAQTKGSDDE